MKCLTNGHSKFHSAVPLEHSGGRFGDSRMLMTERCSEEEDDAGEMKKLVTKIAEITGEGVDLFSVFFRSKRNQRRQSTVLNQKRDKWKIAGGQMEVPGTNGQIKS
ncbi:hypothetical protein LXL04_028936 [Taraxacum kok-saghyz]